MSQSLEQIKSINNHFRHALEQVGDGVIIVEPQSRHPLGPLIVFANRAALEMTGYSCDALIGQPIGMIYEPESLNDLIVRLPKVAEAVDFFETVKEVVDRDRQRIPCRWTISSMKDASGAPLSFILTLAAPGEEKEDAGQTPATEPETVHRGNGRSAPQIDETEAQLEESLEKSRVESLALLASGIAHDFNNVLQTILSNLSLAKLETSFNSPGRQQIEDAIEATQNAESLAQQILDFTKGREPMIEVVNLGDVLKQVAKLSTMGSKTRCDLVTPEGIWGVEADLRQIRQVIHNLLINASQSMPGGGIIQAWVENTWLNGENKPGLPAGPYTVVRVRDRGCGIPEDKVETIFEPYFTTKQNGNGIGLATCRAIIKRHHGGISVSSRVNVGTEFKIFLPSCRIIEDTEAVKLPAVSVDTSQPGGMEVGSINPHLNGIIPGEGRILVVDDQDNVREAAQRLLSKLGYECVSAESGQKAIDLFKRHARSTAPFNAVLLDMTLPGGLSGFEVMDEIRKVDQQARVIATSGYFDDDAESRFREDGYVGILPKPYAVEKLSQKLAEATQY